jgi:hypothetical protein
VRAVGCGVLFGRNVLSVMATDGMREVSNPFGADLGQEAHDMGAGQDESDDQSMEGRAAIERAMQQGGGFVGGAGLLHRDDFVRDAHA